MAHLNIIQSKIISGIELTRELARLKMLGKKIVFTNGCFDIMHRGHIEYLMQAADLGDALLVGLNSDASVKRLKGSNRPIQDQYARALQLAALSCIAYVVIFNEDTPAELIETVQPNVLVKGGDYLEIEKIVGYNTVMSAGGKVLTIPFVEGFSTTGLLEKIVTI